MCSRARPVLVLGECQSHHEISQPWTADVEGQIDQDQLLGVGEEIEAGYMLPYFPFRRVHGDDQELVDLSRCEGDNT